MLRHRSRYRFLLLISLLIIPMLIGVGTTLFLEQVVEWSVFLPMPFDRLASDYVIGVLWATFIGLSILFWPVPEHHRSALLWLWLVRCLITLGAMLLYEANYAHLDAHTYVRIARGEWMSWSPPWQGGTSRLFGLIWLHHRIFDDTYHVLKISLSFIGFIAVYLVYRAFVQVFQRERLALLYLLGLYPSLLFWSSIIGKEPVVLLGIALYTVGVIEWIQHERLRALFILALGITIVVLIRLWMGLILCLPLITFVSVSLRARHAFFLVLMLALLGVSWVFFQRVAQIETVADIVEQVNSLASRFALGESAQHDITEFATLVDVIVFVPLGAFTALFRPLPGEVMNPFGIVAGLENALLLVWILLIIQQARWCDVRDPVIRWAIVLILVWSIVYGFLSYYNFGTAIRYRTQILPILLGLLFYLHQRERPPLLPQAG